MSKDDVAKQEKKAAKKAAKAAAAAAAATGADASAMSVDPDNTTASAVVVDPSSSTAAGASGEDKKKSKKRKSEALDGDDEADDVPIDLSTLSPIAQPLADKKMTKKTFKTIKKASKTKGHVKRGVKEVVKGLRKGEKGLVILAGDISPIDILSHIPVLCEESDVPYIFVSSKEALGAASSTKRPTSTVMIVPDGGKNKKTKVEVKEDYAEDFSSLAKEVKKLNERIVLGTA